MPKLRGKMHKIERGTSDPTGTSALSASDRAQVDKWVRLIDAQGPDIGGVQVVLEDMMEEARLGKLSIEVFREVLARRSSKASIDRILARRAVR